MRISIAPRGLRTVIAAARTTTSCQTTRGPRYCLSCQDIHRICRVGVRKGKGSGRERQKRREIKREFHSTSTSSSAWTPDSSLLGQISRSTPPPSPSPLSSSSATGPSSASLKRIERTDKPAHGNSSGPSGNDGMINCSDKASPPSPPPPQRRKQERDQESDQEQLQDLRPVEQTTINPTSAQISAGASIPAITFPTPTPSTTTTDNTNTATTATITTPSTPSQLPPPPRTLRQIIKSTSIGRAADFYSRMQSRRPYWTQLWCTLFIYLCGDLSAQFVVEDAGKEKGKDGVIGGDGAGDRDGAAVREELMARYGYDPLRTVRHLTVGAVAAVPSYRWFMFLHNNFNYARSKLLSILTKVSINQAIFTPIFNTYFFSMQSLLAGTSLQDTWERLKLALPISVMNSAKLWPAITAFMFMYVDPQFRSIFAGSIAVGWQTYLSWLNQKAARDIGGAVQGEELMGRRSGGGVRATTLATPAVSV
ncbi:uncharacterized protein PADG_11160 [Paracoccidioides brasiliensis Pb18]|uniref:Uncharacterized protein n=2 Tax=Paracoccidioides brasiliensis TaxID=121759 RepID=A0A0A0HWF6_PARBD|nr:uncharacterized protein PADG_11160 [Paracoccidioides brasiliensis Pb18]KGM92703.1 hypothetical protein PADG_11160 [Paracoccidioides brasiliensis Pb18]